MPPMGEIEVMTLNITGLIAKARPLTQALVSLGPLLLLLLQPPATPTIATQRRTGTRRARDLIGYPSVAASPMILDLGPERWRTSS
jgi:hypothetical protein